jgi:hypothetical protein
VDRRDGALTDAHESRETQFGSDRPVNEAIPVADTRFPPSSLLFPNIPSADRVMVVRAWREPASTAPGDEDWRGHVHLSGAARSRRFVGLDHLFRTIRVLLGAAPQRAPGGEAAGNPGKLS